MFRGHPKAEDAAASPFDTSWWKMPTQVVERPQPPPFIPRQMKVTRADIMGLQQNAERRLMEAEDELAKRLRQAENSVRSPLALAAIRLET
jgi:hypothetical protein